MRPRFLDTTVLASAMMAAPAGAAEAAERIKLGLGGTFIAHGVYASQDDGPGEPGAGLRDHKLAREAEVKFKGKATLDNGITFGVSVELEAETCADQIDETYMYVEGRFGRFQIGSDDPVTDLMFVGSPFVIEGIGLSDADDVFSALANGVGTPATVIEISGDSEKLTYFTPRFSGIQLGLSYTPENCEEVRGTCGGSYAGFQSEGNTGQQSEVVEIAANYARRVGAVDLALYAGYGSGEVEGSPAAVATAGVEDQDLWGVGMTLGFAGFTLGADYREDDQGTSGAATDRVDYSFALTYSTGAWTAGAAYVHSEVEAGAGLGEDETDGYQVGATYALGPGIVLTGGVTVWDVQDNLNAPASENDATEFIVGTVVSF